MVSEDSTPKVMVLPVTALANAARLRRQSRVPRPPSLVRSIIDRVAPPPSTRARRPSPNVARERKSSSAPRVPRARARVRARAVDVASSKTLIYRPSPSLVRARSRRVASRRSITHVS
uniref:Uncharacterized protein n=1 Tax=Ostreococcus sp. 'lucimarinus' TaxID=242159 RepID=A0A7R9T671_9CHLO